MSAVSKDFTSEMPVLISGEFIEGRFLETSSGNADIGFNSTVIEKSARRMRGFISPTDCRWDDNFEILQK
jgi:hypothetical protein